MPVIKINTSDRATKDHIRKIYDGIYSKIPECINADIEGIKVLIAEYPAECICPSNAGHMQKGFTLIEVSMWKGRTCEQKRDMCSVLTGIISEGLNIDKCGVWLTINEFDKSNWGKGGFLCDSPG